MIPTTPPTADELLAEIDRVHAEEMFLWVEVSEDPLPSPRQILLAWVELLLGSLAVWLVVITAVSRVVRHLVAS